MESRKEKIWKEFKELLAKKETNKYHSFFFEYCKPIMNYGVFNKYENNLQYLFKIAKKPITGLKVLDVGCGFGVDCILLSLLGAKEAHGIDFNADWIETIEKYLQELGWDLPIYPRQGDASNLPYDDNRFDAVISVEAISHYHDVDNFLKEAYRVLKPGGVLIISDANNGLNFLTRKETYDIWERFENGPTSENFHGHPIRKTFLEMRREIIKENFPGFSEEEVDLIARNTFAFSKQQVLDACLLYAKEAILPSHKFKRGIPAFNPEKNDYIERLFSPKQLAETLNEIGFKAKMYAHFGGAGRRGMIGFINTILRYLTPISIFVARGYKIVAYK